MAHFVLRPTLQGMSPANVVVAVCKRMTDAVMAVSELRRQDIEPGCISVVAVDEQSGVAPVSYYLEDGYLRRAASGRDCPCLWKALPGCAVLVNPGEPVIFLAGSLAACVARTLNNGALFGDLGPVAAGLYSLGLAKEAAREYELAARQGRVLLIVHGRARDVARARGILGGTDGGRDASVVTAFS